MPLGAPSASAASATSSKSDTTPNAVAFPTEAPTASELPPFAERTDEVTNQVTGWLPRKATIATPPPTGGSSSDPPTRFLRGVDQHIELPNGSIVDDYEIRAGPQKLLAMTV